MAARTGGLLAVLLGPPAGMAGQEGAEPKQAPSARVEVPPEYRGFALALESGETASLMTRADEHFAASEWARGLAVLDEVLEKASSPPSRKRPARRAEKKDEKVDPGLARRRVGIRRGMVVDPDEALAEGEAEEAEADVDPREELHSANGILLVPVPAAVRRRLRELPAEAQEIYRRTYESPAREALEKARGLEPSKALRELRRIGERYPLTRSGLDAWQALAGRLLDAGRPAEAALALEGCFEMETEPSGPARAASLALLAAARLLAGAAPAADRALRDLERAHSETMILVRGEAVPGRSLRDHPVFRDLARRGLPALPGAAWPTGRGAFHHAALAIEARALPALGSQAKWVHGQGPEKQSQRAVRVDAGQQGGGRGIAAEGRVHVRRRGELLTIDARSGKKLWTVDPSDISFDERREAGYQPVTMAGDETLDRGLALWEPRRPGGRPLVVVVDRPLKAGLLPSGKVLFQPNRLAAYDSKSGKLAWVTRESKDPRDPARRLGFAASPVVAGEMLVAPALRGQHFYAVGIRPGGKIAWVRRLQSKTEGSYERYGNFYFPACALAARDGVVVATQGDGLITALEATAGGVLWASRYRSGSRLTRTPMPSLHSNLPVLTSRLVLLAPPDSEHLTAFDIATGRIVWERQLQSLEGAVLLGANEKYAFLGTERLIALGLDDGKEAWRSEPMGSLAGRGTEGSLAAGLDDEVSRVRITSAIVLEERVVATSTAGLIAVLDAADGRTLSKMRILDRRMPQTEEMHLLLAAGELVAVTPGRIFAVEPQEASWTEVGGEARTDLHQRARLLRAEGRFAEALESLDTLRARVKSEDLRQELRDEIVSLSEAAARATGKAAFIADLLARPDRLVTAREEVLALRLLAAKLRAAAGAGKPEHPETKAAGAIYLELVRLDGVTARSPEGFEVDVGAYASDALAELRAAGVPISVPLSEEAVRSSLEKTSGDKRRTRAAHWILRRSHLDEVAALELDLAKAAEEDGDPELAADTLALHAADFPRAPGTAEARARAEALRRSLPPEPIAEGLEEVLAARGGKRLAQLFWIDGAEAFLARGDEGSAPLPALPAIAGTRLRLYGEDGKVLLERALPEYPDVSEIKLTIESSVEEPAVAHRRGDSLILSTAAGIYAFNGLGVELHAAAPNPRAFKLAWVKAMDHPFLGFRSRGGWWGSQSLPTDHNTFPETTWGPGGQPIVLLPGGEVVALDRGNGRVRWRLPSESQSPVGRATLRGPWVATRSSQPAGIHLRRLPGDHKSRSFQGPPGDGSDALLAAGDLIALFAGESIEATDTATGRSLWRRKGMNARLVCLSGRDVWISEDPAKLTLRSLRSGRLRKTIDLPRLTRVAEVFPERDSGGTPSGWTLVLSQGTGRVTRWGHGNTQTGVDLFLLRLDAAGEKLWQTRLHEGAVTHGGGRFLTRDGRFIFAYNGEADQEKWYTRVVCVEPKDGSTEEFLSLEVRGKGTGQPPRLCLLAGGLGVGNSDGFGWFAPAAKSGTKPEDDTKKGN